MHAFISHISEESALALVLKEWLETTLLGQCEVFVSSDAATLPIGTKWLSAIDVALKQANVMIVLCSAASLPRPWVNFETGCAWSRTIPILPICHSGVTRGSLPRPLSEFQALDLTDAKFVELFFSALVKHLGLKKMPRVDADAMRKELTVALGATSGASIPTEAPKPLPDTTDLPEECWKILEFLAKQSGDVPLKAIELQFKWPNQRAKYFMDELVAAKLVDMILNFATGASYLLAGRARKLLYARGLL